MNISNASELRETYGEPLARSGLKVLDYLDEHCQNFISLSPFCLIGTSAADGRADVSPRGDPPGFVAVLDDHTLLIPDRPGNRQADSLGNVIEQPQVGLLFLVPGMNETLRVSGKAEIVTDPALLTPLSVSGKRPISGLRITIEKAFFHCGKALVRSRLWDPETQIERSSFPTYGQVLADQIDGADAREIDASAEEATRNQLY